VNKKSTVTSDKWQVIGTGAQPADLVTRHPSPVTRRAFTLIEVMVVMVLLSLIVVALMGVFSSTQAAFRASVTQTDVLEGGRAAMDLITGDLRAMSPSLGTSNIVGGNLPAVNLCITNYNYPILTNSLVASGNIRSNLLDNIFILSRGNQNGVPTWYGTGYAVYVSPTNLYSLYRFSTSKPMAAATNAASLFYAYFQNFLAAPNGTNYSHLLDGVVGFKLSPFDADGKLIFTNRTNIRTNYSPNGVCYLFYSNALPASVEIEMATLEDRTLQRAGSRGIAGQSPLNVPAQWQYLAGQAGNLHVFRQRVAIPNVDPAAYR